MTENRTHSAYSQDAARKQEAAELLTAEITDEFMERVNRGEQPDVEEYADRYPELAGVLRDLLPALRAMSRPDSGAPETSGRWGSNSCVEGCLGDYQILKEIARGGMGVVYEAKQISLGRRVALKVLPFAAALDSKQLERFKREAQAAAHLHHSNIVPVYGVGCERGVYYYAMQYIEGQSLSQVIAGLRHIAGRDAGRREPSSGALSETITYLTSGGLPSHAAADSPPASSDSTSLAPPGAPAAELPTQTQAAVSTEQSLHGPAFHRTVALLGIQAAEALEHAHSLGVVHRDVKPANLLIDGHGHLWVTDFGLARYQAEADLTLTGDMLGTLRYMSPQQALGKRGVVDHRADIYSLGATLYELLTQEPVWSGRDRRELLQQIAFEEPVSPRRVSRSIPADLETIVCKALAKEPEERYASAREMAEDLRRFLENKPILARKPSLAERAAKWSRRHRSVVVSGVVLLVMAVVALAVSNVLIAQARSNTETALQLLEEKQRETNAALLAEERERRRAQGNFEQARQMLDYFVQVAEQDLDRTPEVREVRQRLLESALGYYQEFLKQCGDDPEAQSELASSLFRLGSVFYEIGSPTDAAAAYEQASEIQWRLAREHPDDPEIQRGLFAIYRHLGVLSGRGNLFILGQESVQDHLQLTEAQRFAVKRLADEYWDWHRDLRHERHLGFEERREQIARRSAELDEPISELLEPGQQARLKEISLQLRGTQACSDPDVAAALGLSEIQRTRIEQIKSKSHKDLQELWASSERFWTKREKARASRQNAHEKIVGALTVEQMAKFRELAGEPFNHEIRFGYHCKFRSRDSDKGSSKRKRNWSSRGETGGG